MAESDFSRSYIIGYGSSPSRCGPAAVAERSIARSPGSRAKSVCTCQVLRPRRVDQALAMARLFVLPSALETASAPGDWLYRGRKVIADHPPHRSEHALLTHSAPTSSM
jgi:hypothetical protein